MFLKVLFVKTGKNLSQIIMHGKYSQKATSFMTLVSGEKKKKKERKIGHERFQLKLVTKLVHNF